MNQYHRFQPLKILAYAERSLLPIVRGEMPYPIDWRIYPSNRCNHCCEWCVFRQNREQFDYPEMLSEELLLKAVTDASSTNAVFIEFTGGGEPLQNQHTIKALEHAQFCSSNRIACGGAKLTVGLTTNGRYLSQTVAMQCNTIRVSLNAGTPEQHHKTNHGGKGRGDWEAIIDNIRQATSCRLGDLGLAFVVDADNWRDIPPFVRLAAGLGVDFAHIRPAFWYDTAEDAKVRAIMPDALRLCDQAKAEVAGCKTQIHALTSAFDGYWTPREYHRCRAVLTGMCLRATGNFAVCQDRVDLTFGNVPSYRDGATFQEVWHSQEHKDIVAKIHDGCGGELPRCPRCVWNSRNQAIESLEHDSLRLGIV